MTKLRKLKKNRKKKVDCHLLGLTGSCRTPALGDDHFLLIYLNINITDTRFFLQHFQQGIVWFHQRERERERKGDRQVRNCCISSTWPLQSHKLGWCDPMLSLPTSNQPMVGYTRRVLEKGIDTVSGLC